MTLNPDREPHSDEDKSVWSLVQLRATLHTARLGSFLFTRSMMSDTQDSLILLLLGIAYAIDSHDQAALPRSEFRQRFHTMIEFSIAP